MRNETDFLTQLRRRNVARRNSVYQDFAFLRIVHARNQVDQGALAAAGRTNHTQSRTGGHAEADVTQDPSRFAIGVGWIVKSDVPELDRST